MLALRVLGELAVLRDGAEVRLPQSRKTRALLGFLALEARPHRRDRLVSLFWDVPDDPRGALRWSLSKLREVVDDDDLHRLIADRETVAFSRERTEIDLAIARALDTGTASTASLEAAEAAFTGELLTGLDLPDCHDYQAWLAAQREEAVGLHRRLLDALCTRHADHPERALPFARRFVDRAPHDAEARARLLRLLVASGKRQEAEEHYRLGSRLLDEAGGAGAATLRKAWIELRQPPAAQPTAASVAPATMLNRPAIAVLPFENMSGDPEQDYFADGMTDDIITALSQWRWFPVIARASTFAYKGRVADVLATGRELGARYVVQGSVRRAGERLRITAQLVDALGGHQLWAERYDRSIGDVFALQDELTAAIVTQVAPELARVEGQRAERKAPGDLNIWDLNLRALALIHQGTAEAFREARSVLERSLGLNPSGSHTHALVAYANYHEALLVWLGNVEDTSGRVLRAAQTAVQLDERNWLAHALHGISVLWHRRDYDTAAQAEQQALVLNPSAALAHQFQGCVLTFAGEPRQALVHLEAALRLNPQGGATTLLRADMALAHLMLGQYQEAVATARQAVGQFGGDVRALQRLAAALGHLGRQTEAAEALEELQRRQGNLSRRYIEATYPFRDPAHLDALVEGLTRAGWSGG